MGKERKEENTLSVANFISGFSKILRASLPNLPSLFTFISFVSKKENNSKNTIDTTSGSGNTVTTGSVSDNVDNKPESIKTQKIAPRKQVTAPFQAAMKEAKNRVIVENDERKVEEDKREIYQDAIERYYSYSETSLATSAIKLDYGLEELNLPLEELEKLEKILQGEKTIDGDNPPLIWLESNNIFIKRQGKYEIPKNRHSPFVMNMLTLAVLNEYGQMMVRTFGTPNESVRKKHRLQCLKAFIHQKEMEPNRDFRNDIRNMIDFIYNSNKDTKDTIDRMMREGGRRARFPEVKGRKNNTSSTKRRPLSGRRR